MLRCPLMSPGKYQPKDAMNSPRFSQPATFMRLPYVPELEDVDIALTGIAYDGRDVLPAGSSVWPEGDTRTVVADPSLQPDFGILPVR